MSHDRYRFAPRKRARKRCVQALYQWDMTGDSPETIVSQFLNNQDFRRVDTDYFVQLLNGAINDIEALDEKIRSLADRDWKQIERMERAVLRLGAYELRHQLDIPYRIAINESVNLASEYSTDQATTYVNAILDKLAQDWRAAEYGREAVGPAKD